jgi:hypothetical protein
MFLVFSVDIAYVTITAVHLYDKENSMCLISTTQDDMNWCNLIYVSGGVSTSFVILVSLLTVWNHKLVYATRAVCICLLSSWHSTIASLVTLISVDADDENVPGEKWRVAVWSLLWSAVGLSVIASFLNPLCVKKRPMQQEPTNPPITHTPIYGV